MKIRKAKKNKNLEKCMPTLLELDPKFLCLKWREWINWPIPNVSKVLLSKVSMHLRVLLCCKLFCNLEERWLLESLVFSLLDLLHVFPWKQTKREAKLSKVKAKEDQNSVQLPALLLMICFHNHFSLNNLFLSKYLLWIYVFFFKKIIIYCSFLNLNLNLIIVFIVFIVFIVILTFNIQFNLFLNCFFLKKLLFCLTQINFFYPTKQVQTFTALQFPFPEQLSFKEQSKKEQSNPTNPVKQLQVNESTQTPWPLVQLFNWEQSNDSQDVPENPGLHVHVFGPFLLFYFNFVFVIK